MPVDNLVEIDCDDVDPDIAEQCDTVQTEDSDTAVCPCEVETDVLQAREIGPAIIDEAVERGVDVILMGIKYKKSFGQFSLGNVVPYVLKNSPCPVILYPG